LVPSSSLHIRAWPPEVKLRENAVAERTKEEDPSIIMKALGLGGVESGEDGDGIALQKEEDGTAHVSSSSVTKSMRGDSTGVMPELEVFKDENHFNRLIMHVITTTMKIAYMLMLMHVIVTYWCSMFNVLW
jgi:hypothetical protein